MIILSILAALFAAAAGIFAALFFTIRNSIMKYEKKSESLSKELTDLKCEFARLESQEEGRITPLSIKSVEEFLKREKAASVKVEEQTQSISFETAGQRYHIDCSRFPRQVVLFKGWNVDPDQLHWDVLTRAALEVTKALVMVKTNVYEDSYDFMIVSPDHTIASFKDNFDFYMSLISDAERKLSDEYWKIMEIEHPEECSREDEQNADEQAGESASAEEIAIKLAQSAGKKMQS